MKRCRLRLAGLVVMLAAAGCELSEVGAPALAGPSELGLSLSLAADPDVLIRNGVSRARVSVTARDASGRPIRGLTLNIDVEGDESAIDSGRLSRRTVTTGERGYADVSYIAPRTMPGTESSTVAIVFTPVGTNYSNTVPRQVLIRLVPPSAIP